MTTVSAKSIVPQLVPKYVPPLAWDALPRVTSTVVEMETRNGVASIVDPVAKRKAQDARFWAEVQGRPLPPEDFATRHVMFSQYLGMFLPRAEPLEADYARFGRVITELLETRTLAAVMGDPVLVPLATEILDGWEPMQAEGAPPKPRVKQVPPSCLLYAILYVDMPNVGPEVVRCSLNARLGFPAFLREGDLPPQWPSE